MEDNDLISITGGPLRQHEYVLVKSYQTAGDVRYIQNRNAKTRMTPGTKDVEVVMTLGDIQFATFQRMVRGWNLFRRIKVEGVEREIPIPFIQEKLEACIDSLDSKVYNYILRRMNEIYGDAEDSESDENFQPAVIDSSEDNLNAERVLRLNR